jgi:hypothetical protein
MSQAELHELVFLTLSQVDASFQFWLSATFAVILAAYLAPHRLNLILVLMVSALYIATTALLSFRMLYVGELFAMYTQSIHELPPPSQYSRWFSPLRTPIVLLGTLSAVAYLVYGYMVSRSRE